MPDHAEIVADEEDREVEVAAQLHEQVQDLRLDRHVERRHRLVADEELGADGERAGDADALTLAAGELAGEPVGMGRLETGQLEQPTGRRGLRDA